MLGDAASAIDRDDVAGAITALLAVWREVKDPRVANALDRLSARIARPAIAGTHKEMTAKLAELVALDDPLDQPRIAAVIGTTRSPQMVEQLEFLLARGRPDPRYTTAFVALLKKPPFIGSGAQSAWRRMFKVLQTWGDPRVLDLLPALDFRAIVTAHHPNTGSDGSFAATFFRERSDAVCAAIEKRYARERPRLPSSAQVALAQIEARLGAPTLETALVAEVQANPDGGAHVVLADHLLEKGDEVRGRFLVLQQQRAAGTLDASGAREERELIAAHGVRWIGELADVVEHATMRFENGFLAWCVIDARKPAVLAKTIGSPAWATVRGVHVEGDFPHDLLVHDVMRSLDEVTGIRHRAGIGAVLDKPHTYPWQTVGLVNGDYDRMQLARRVRAVFPDVRALHLNAYRASVDQFAFVWGPDYAGLTTIGFTAVSIDAIAPYLTALLANAPVTVTTLEVCELHHIGWRIRLHGERKLYRTLDLQARAAWGRRSATFGDLAKVLSSLGLRFQTVRLHDRATKAERAAIEASLLEPGGTLRTA